MKIVYNSCDTGLKLSKTVLALYNSKRKDINLSPIRNDNNIARTDQLLVKVVESLNISSLLICELPDDYAGYYEIIEKHRREYIVGRPKRLPPKSAILENLLTDLLTNIE